MNNRGWESGNKMTESVRKESLGVKAFYLLMYFLMATGAVLVMVAAQFLAGFALGLITYLADIDFNALEGTVTFVYTLIAIPLLLLYIRAIRPKKTPICMNGKLNVAQVVFVVVLAFGMMGIVTAYLLVASQLAEKFAPVAEQIQDYNESVDRYAVIEASKIPVFDHILNFIGVCILVPITEELTFRVGVLDTLLKRCHPVAAVLLSGIAFGALHMQLVQIGYALIAGFFLGWVYYYTKSIKSTMLMHILFNIFGSGIQTLMESGMFGDMSSAVTSFNVFTFYLEFALILPSIASFFFLRAMYKNSIKIDTRVSGGEAPAVLSTYDPVADFVPDENAPSPFVPVEDKEDEPA